MNLYTITRGKGGVIAWTDEQVAYIINKYTNENFEFSCEVFPPKRDEDIYGIF